VQVPLAVAAVTVVLRVATLPFRAASQEHRLRNGLSEQRWADWVRDVLVSTVVSTVSTAVVLVLLVGFARRWRTAWVPAAAVVLGGLVVVGSLAYPVVVEPLFNRFTPLQDGPLRSAVMEVAEREGVAVDEVLVADASRRTTTLNAYVSGIGGTRRVVLYDTLVESVPQDQTLAVVAHELAHARHHDVVTGTVLAALGVGLGVALLALVLGRERIRTVSAVPLVLALVAVGALVASPVENGISRRIETRADVDALKATGDPVAFREVQTMLALRSLADPTPPRWSHYWWGSHPTVLERLALAEARRPD
jgi:STE24 endopeptidase